MRWLILLLSTAVPAMAAPMSFPTLGNVRGVAAGDVLNIRAAPSAGASVLGELPPDAAGVEVMAAREGWYLVNTAERSGWVNGRYLALGPDPFAKGAVPANLRCIGTEPFWALAVDGEAMVMTSPQDQDGTRFALQQVLAAPAGDPGRSFLADGLTAVIAPAQCSDGMSDRAYALGATLILGAAPDAVLYAGCCTVAPR